MEREISELAERIRKRSQMNSYKDRYQHSIWLAMMEERLRLVPPLLRDDGVFFVSSDDTENFRLWPLLGFALGRDNYLGSFV